MVLAFKYFTDRVQQEYDRRARPSMLVPPVFYRARTESYRYWNLARLAHGKEAFFTYYFYDPSTVV